MSKIVYVEDDEINAFVFSRLLRRDHDVTHYFDGESFINEINRSDVDMVFVDINLGSGKMDGTQVMKSIKSIPEYSRLPIVALTAFAFHEDELKFLEEGFDAYLSKPIDQQELKSIISKWT